MDLEQGYTDYRPLLLSIAYRLLGTVSERYAYGCEYAEIADIVGKSADNCRKIFSRAGQKTNRLPSEPVPSSGHDAIDAERGRRRTRRFSAVPETKGLSLQSLRLWAQPLLCVAGARLLHSPVFRHWKMSSKSCGIAD
ncbi:MULTISPECIES: hypothetical protein [unclassified Paenibacillus]|uniref:hypothetical protein n=1 Tax=unclassified Paenibacillus TaxID=185978 RepID=UPI001C106B0A|nr:MULTISPECIES: hypothetical protein [unclassified Paenibacillus]MBU5441320.1 hypothetical protein [Paenibacillus sp. MSJ-34]CAH0120886.1 hypothetical protein PAE9249_03410 [Paenibacillus sp. CECT 9249]